LNEGLKDQSKHKTKKNKALKRLFGLASKDVFFPCVLFAIGMQKTKKNTCVFFWFLVIFSNHRPSNKQKKQKVFVWFLAVKAKTKQ
jgi:hypothetical protein